MITVQLGRGKIVAMGRDPSKRTVAIDARYLESPLSGIGRYTLNLLTGIAQLPPSNLRLIALFSDSGTPARKDLRSAGIEWIEVAVNPRRLKNQLILPSLLSKGKVDLLHTPDAFAPLLWPGRVLLTIHDLIPISCRRLLHSSTKSRLIWLWQAWLALQCRHAAAILTVSQRSANDLKQFLNLSGDRIHIVHNGVSPLPIPTQQCINELRQAFQLHGQIILYVGRRDPTKNLACLVRAFSILRPRLQRHINLVIAGQQDPRYLEAEQEAERCGVVPWVVHTGFVDDRALAALYQEADVFAFPSAYEGYGLPPLEAMCSGTPVVAADHPVEHEVLGDAAMFVDPSSPGAWADALEHVLTNRSTADTLRRRGRAQVEKRTVASQAARTLRVYEDLLSHTEDFHEDECRNS